jgi:glutathione S-transferase
MSALKENNTVASMTLFYSVTSPFARKVRIIAREKNLTGLIDETLANPMENPAALLASNPLGKIPALIREDGSALYDSPVICEYLDSISDKPLLIPAAGEARWRVLRAQALADGLLDAAVACVFEARRPGNEQSPAAITRWKEQMARALLELEKQLPLLPADINLGNISFVCALGYLDLRHADLQWRAMVPTAARWFAEFSQRASVQATQPQ